MKELTLLLFVALLSTTFNAQNTMKGKTQINAGVGLSGYGIPVYVGLDYGVHPDVSIGVEGSWRSYANSGSNANVFGVGGNVNYHFNSLFKIKDNHWDLYAGGTLGYWAWNWDYNYPGAKSSGLNLGAQIGGRYFFNPNWAINLELGGGTLSGGKFGLTYRL